MISKSCCSSFGTSSCASKGRWLLTPKRRVGVCRAKKLPVYRDGASLVLGLAGRQNRGAFVESPRETKAVREQVQYSPRERFWLWTLAIFGLVTVNGAFVYGLFQPAALAEAMTNPLALAFILEALVLVGVIAYLLSKWGVSGMSWQWFVGLSLLGSIAFALPVVLLWNSGRIQSVEPDT